MALDAPRLDSRTYADLVAEARARIPRYTPEWTNLNDSDPGMTLVQLNAWLTETILYELNRVPELNYVKFLDLIGVKPKPALAARTELSFRLKPLSAAADPLTVPIPLGTSVEVDDPALKTKVVFETDYTLIATNAAVGAVIAGRAGPAPLELVTEFDDKKAEPVWLHSFAPFAAGAPLLIGLVLRPVIKGAIDQYSQDRWPAGQLDLYVDAAQVFDADATGATIAGPLAHECRFPWEVAAAAAGVRWELLTGSTTNLVDGTWTELAVAGDETAGLARSGHIRLELPDGAARVSPDALTPAFWESLGLAKPPRTLPELLAALRDPDLALPRGLTDADWQKMGLPDDRLASVANCCADGDGVATAIEALPPDIRARLDPAALDAEAWGGIEPLLSRIGTPFHAGVARPLYWLRATRTGAGDPALLTAIRLNTVPATAAATRLDARLGTSNGRPGQAMTLPAVPVLIDPVTGAPDIAVEVAEADDGLAWTRVDDFFAQAADARVFTLDPVAGVVGFGDGRRGRIPVAGAQVRAVRYRTGGGAVGNVGSGTITKLKGALRHVDGVTNPRAVTGGSDAEAQADVLLKAPSELRRRDRAVSAEDFAEIARATPGASIHRAYALARRRPRASGFAEADGAVSVVVLPANEQDTPQPSEAQLRAVCAYLEPRRLVTTELHVTGPRYTPVARLAAIVRVARDAELRRVGEAATAALLTFLHPLRGGADSTGWPFGADIFHGDLYELLLGVAGVRRVSGLTLRLDGVADTDPLADVTALAAGHLPWLRRDRIALEVVYDRD